MIKIFLLSWFVLVYLTTGLLVNLLQLLILPLFWLHRSTYQILTNKLAYCLFSVVTFLGDWWGGTNLYLYGKQEDIALISKEKSLTVINHYGDIDWLTSWVFAERLGFIERTNCFIKDSIKYVPTMGWCWWFAGWGFLKRNWKNDETQMENYVDACKKNKTNYSITLFCEGTRRTAEKLKASQEYAIKTGKTPLKHHLCPRTKGFAVVVNKLRDHFASIFDAEIAFPNPEKATVAALLNRETVEVHIHLRRIPMSEVTSTTEDDASDFCINLYKEKDELMEHFKVNQCFPGKRVNLPRTSSNLIVFIMHNVWVALFYTSLLKYCAALYGSKLVLTFVGISSIIGYIILRVLLRFTESKKGSSFGLKNSRDNNNETIKKKE